MNAKVYGAVAALSLGVAGLTGATEVEARSFGDFFRSHLNMNFFAKAKGKRAGKGFRGLGARFGLPSRNFNGDFEPKKAIDWNPKPDVVEVYLTAKKKKIDLGDGQKVEMWTYNGQFPGPQIEAKKGDKLIVHLKNMLPEDAHENRTTIHWHGVDLPANMDGSMIAQKRIKRGETFTYEFDLLRAATYWYHPHVRGKQQVEWGLQGTLIVRDPAEDRRLKLPRNEYVAVLDDVLLKEENGETKFAKVEPEDPVKKAERLVNGLEGNKLLVNGQHVPTLYVRPGQPVRLRLVNTANATFQRLSFPNDSAYRIGGGQGLLQHPEKIDQIAMVHDDGDHGMDMDMGGGMHMSCSMDMGHGDDMDGGMDDGMDHGGGDDMDMISNPSLEQGVMLTPGERAEVVFTPQGKKGDVEYIQWHDFPKGRHIACENDHGVGLGHDMMDGQMAPENLIKLVYVDNGRRRGGRDYVPPQELRPIEKIDASGAEPLPVTMGHGQPDHDGDIEFFAQVDDNGNPIPWEDVTPADALDAKVGETRVWEVTNTAMGDHNFHIHGFTFQHFETVYEMADGTQMVHEVPEDEIENKDTIRVPAGATVRLAVKFDDTGREGTVEAFGKTPTETRSGGWLFHCHFLEHAEAGMMSFLEVTY